MGWKVEYDEALGIVVDTYIGRNTGKDFTEVAEKRIALGKEKGTLMTLIDASKLETDISTTFDVYDIADRLYAEQKNRIKWRIAVIVPESSKARDQVGFFVTMCKNRGLVMEEFAQRKDALNWLLAQRPSS